MPQLDTSTWFMTITLMIIGLFCIFQLKMLNQTMINITPQDKQIFTKKETLPWENKWTKIYLPHLLPLQS
uniref:ATP synthase complex subunit 8 n=1 Tax=Rhyncholestes raphanurus TaxID=33559 RepID=Q70XJ4_RHYRA|nr:ATP synthase F0 subunit 8 [Rhyncholestes raphanurus]CAD48217.1 ATP synthase F0 subunit 8 [Rhyncholestes raphanurus]